MRFITLRLWLGSLLMVLLVGLFGAGCNDVPVVEKQPYYGPPPSSQSSPTPDPNSTASEKPANSFS